MVTPDSELWSNREFMVNDTLYGGSVRYATIGGTAALSVNNELVELDERYYSNTYANIYLARATNRVTDVNMNTKRPGVTLNCND